ncbi:3-hydroxyacyl-[acyl-carrier-protein] dehydratase [Natronocella acetinitrilica]|uniref:3-hydroxyacyl-[acyl-carrier-protein] dehydratase FabZ n=1 Tax=Natronocella acetinitrilica TaxID=414046 RepID=A0AAE3G675_9GAMM|nr:3-hydroxyacyl-ACP dehydratase FabZ [Natronocella acetinitrilica]MCP1676157.1 3-hydroxyacyl-[acyl-carrier-protein] dehydratase [Natronocella acetinitrilica]
MKRDQDNMDIHQIRAALPHRYPFLLVDRVLESVPGERLVGIKNVSVNEPFFQGHFPQRPVMPGVLLVEAMAQACGLLAFETEGEWPEGNKIFYLVGSDKVRFKRPVEPGDQVRMEVSILRRKRGIWVFDGIATVDGNTVAEAEIMCTMRDLTI